MHAYDNDDNVELMLRVRGGDEAAFAELVERHRDRVMSIVSRYLRDRTEAEDLAQEVFLNVYRSRATYRPEARFSTWLFRITANLSLNAVRSRAVRKKVQSLTNSDADDASRRVEDLPDPRSESTQLALEKNELAAEVRRVVDALPDNQKTAVVLNKYQGCSYEEVAEIMDLSISAVKSLLSRARMNIKERLTPFLQNQRVS